MNLCSNWWFIEYKTMLERDMTCSHDIGTEEKLSFILFKKFTKTIFVINDATSTARSASYLDLHLETDSEGLIRKKPKRDDFTVPIVNFPFICSSSHIWSIYLLIDPLRNICVTNIHGYVLPVISISRSFPHS